MIFDNGKYNTPSGRTVEVVGRFHGCNIRAFKLDKKGQRIGESIVYNICNKAGQPVYSARYEGDHARMYEYFNNEAKKKWPVDRGLDLIQKVE